MANRVFIAASLDGYIARSDGALDWLLGIKAPAGEDYGYADFIKKIDAVVMGRATFEWVRKNASDWPYERPVFVLTRSPRPPAQAGKYEYLSGAPEAIVKTLRGRGFNNLYLDGGRTIQGFLRAGLVDELTVTRVPILLGSGISLFGDLPRDVALKHAGTVVYPNGLVKSTYEIVRLG